MQCPRCQHENLPQQALTGSAGALTGLGGTPRLPRAYYGGSVKSRRCAGRRMGAREHMARILLTGAGSGAANSLMRDLRAGDSHLYFVGCSANRFALTKSSADRNYLVDP